MVFNREKEFGKVYKTGETSNDLWNRNLPIKKSLEKKLDVSEMKMLRWMCGATRHDKIRNERIRGTTKVSEISKKEQERRLQ